jgi:predicted TIM-barrel fold metal-dependent hydrolase
MKIDCHVHVSALTPGHGSMSKKLRESLAFRFMQWRLGIGNEDAEAERQIEAKLAETVSRCSLDAAVILAFDAVYGRDGVRDDRNTHLYVTNEYAMELCKRHKKMLFGASVHPYRKDAIAELEKCVKGGAVLMKWLPPVQGFDPSDELCIPFYEALVHYKLVLLCHTGGEQSLPRVNDRYADPELLRPALERGVKIIAAHCGTRSRPKDPDFVPAFVKMVHEYENLYGDTSALNLPTRWYAYDTVLKDDLVRGRLVHGSDWPILPVPSPRHLGWQGSWQALQEKNWMERDVKIKKKLGFDEAYWNRGAEVLGIPS